MGWKFWAVMGLIALLVGLIVYYQVEIAARPVPSGLAGTSWTLAYYTVGNGTLVPATGATYGNPGLRSGKLLPASPGSPAVTGTRTIIRSMLPRFPWTRDRERSQR